MILLSHSQFWSQTLLVLFLLKAEHFVSNLFYTLVITLWSTILIFSSDIITYNGSSHSHYNNNYDSSICWPGARVYCLSLIPADTTDVQVITATLMEGVNASIIQCEFIAESTASGCMVVLTGFIPYHVNLTRNPTTNLAIATVTLEHPPSCYTGVEAFDIESDGSVGSLAVPGQLGGRLETPCIIAVETLPGKLF